MFFKRYKTNYIGGGGGDGDGEAAYDQSDISDLLGDLDNLR